MASNGLPDLFPGIKNTMGGQPNRPTSLADYFQRERNELMKTIQSPRSGSDWTAKVRAAQARLKEIDAKISGTGDLTDYEKYITGGNMVTVPKAENEMTPEEVQAQIGKGKDSLVDAPTQGMGKASVIIGNIVMALVAGGFSMPPDKMQSVAEQLGKGVVPSGMNPSAAVNVLKQAGIEATTTADGGLKLLGENGAQTATEATGATAATDGGASATGVTSSNILDGGKGKFSFGNIAKQLAGTGLSKLLGGDEAKLPTSATDLMTPMQLALTGPITESLLSNLQANIGARDDMLKASQGAFNEWTSPQYPLNWGSMSNQQQQNYANNLEAQKQGFANYDEMKNQTSPVPPSSPGFTGITDALNLINSLKAEGSIPMTKTGGSNAPAAPSAAPSGNPRADFISQMAQQQAAAPPTAESFEKTFGVNPATLASDPSKNPNMDSWVNAISASKQPQQAPRPQQAFGLDPGITSNKPSTATGTTSATTPTQTTPSGKTDTSDLTQHMTQRPDNMSGGATGVSLPGPYNLDFLKPQVWSDYGGKLQLDTPETEGMVQNALTQRLTADKAGKIASSVADQQQALANESLDTSKLDKLYGNLNFSNPYIGQIADVAGKVGVPGANEYIKKTAAMADRSENENSLSAALLKAMGSQGSSDYQNALYEASVNPLRRELNTQMDRNASDLASRGLGTSTVITDANDPYRRNFLEQSKDLGFSSAAKAQELALQERMSAQQTMQALEQAIGQRGLGANTNAGQLQQALNEYNQAGLKTQGDLLTNAGNLQTDLGKLRLAGKESDIGIGTTLANLQQRQQELKSNILNNVTNNAVTADNSQRQNISDLLTLQKQQEDRNLLNIQLPYEEWQKRVANQNNSVNQALAGYAGQTPLMEAANQNAIQNYQNKRQDQAGLNQVMSNAISSATAPKQTAAVTAQPLNYTPVSNTLTTGQGLGQGGALAGANAPKKSPTWVPYK